MTKLIKLLILGGGTSCIETIDLINEINRFNKNKIKIIGILDDDNKIQKKKINGHLVLGKINTYKKYRDCNFFMNIFSYKNRFTRHKLISSFGKSRKKFINLIHPHSLISNNATLGFGNIIYNNCNIFAKSKIGNFNILYPNVSIAPNSEIKDNIFLAKNVALGLKTKIHNSCSIQINTAILENVKLSNGIRTMPNSIITETFTQKNIIIGGYPARFITYEKKI